ncbi:synaptosomal-associated protein 25-like [Hydractinia symbiolongicarpus]|uniref:synaptosomal-associated protein 25-like n=1 Tax=Hydractinia symbiolongicarpus TaxID=13093 RepID=UPI00254CBFDF|nr:synaptosomal-associated protein 25-like [Hydractinia symbiolongicarpus]
MEDEEKMRMQIRQMQKRGNEITDESLESTRRILQMAEETQETGIKTMVTLDEQGERLDHIEEELEDINANVREAEENLTKMERFCGLCLCSCRRPRNFEKTEQYKKAFGQIAGPHTKKNKNVKKTEESGNFIQRVTNDAREDEMEDNMKQVAGIVNNLESMALDMGDELKKQNSQLDRITDQTNANAERIDVANKHAEQLLADN